MNNQIKVLVYPVGKAPLAKKIDGSLESMQEIVGGSIQYVHLGSITEIEELNDYVMYCNEEGKLLGLPLNLIAPADFVVGDFFITKLDDDGESVSLTNDDIEKIVYQMESNSNLVLAQDVEKIKEKIQAKKK